MSMKTLWCKKCGKVAHDLAHVVDALRSCPACGSREISAEEDAPLFPLDPSAPDHQEDLRVLYNALEARVAILEQSIIVDPPADPPIEVSENPGLTDGEQEPPAAA